MRVCFGSFEVTVRADFEKLWKQVDRAKLTEAVKVEKTKKKSEYDRTEAHTKLVKETQEYLNDMLDFSGKTHPVRTGGNFCARAPGLTRHYWLLPLGFVGGRV